MRDKPQTAKELLESMATQKESSVVDSYRVKVGMIDAKLRYLDRLIEAFKVLPSKENKEAMDKVIKSINQDMEL